MPADLAAEAGGDPLALVELLLSVVDEGRRTATYKLAVLLALLDCVAAGSGPAGRASDLVSTRELARRVVELYWPQVRDYGAAGGRLRQSTQVRAITVDAVADLRRAAEAAGATTVASLLAVRPVLTDLQHGRCFYCAGNLAGAAVPVDHFLPWARVPTNALSNLVAADGGCNLDKRDHYPDTDLLRRWVHRPWSELAAVSAVIDWPLHQDSSASLLRSLYGHLPTGTRLWHGRGSFVLLTPAARREALALLAV